MTTPAWRHPEILEAWAAFESMRRLGFSSDDLYFMIDKENLHIQLKTQGKVFTYASGPRPEGASNEEVYAMWKALVKAMADGEFTEDEALAFWKKSRIAERSSGLIFVLERVKGIKIPTMERIRSERRAKERKQRIKRTN